MTSHDLASLFAGKCKGRDWYDFLWYLRKKTAVNFDLLKSSLGQAGPYSEADISPSPKWLIHELDTKIESLDWSKNRHDVDRFLSDRDG